MREDVGPRNEMDRVKKVAEALEERRRTSALAAGKGHACSHKHVQVFMAGKHV